jgi:hypothetical protein
MDIVNLNNIKRKLEALLCPKCNKHPSISVTGNKLEVNCCCESFKRHINSAVKKELAAQAKPNIDKMVKNIFKKFQ